AGLDTTLPREVASIPGKGIRALVDDTRILVGNAALLTEYGIHDPHNRGTSYAESLAAMGKTPMLVAIGDTVAGVIGMADSVRDNSRYVVDALHRLKIASVVMLTGDAASVARAIADQTNIGDIRAELLPEEKLTAVEQLKADGHVVAMVGDGVNDAPALAIADVGVAMGAAGSAVAVETADIALMADDLMGLPHAIALARRTRRVMRQNITIALATVGILFAGVFAGGVTMAIGMLVHELSVLVVIANAMRLLKPGADA
ncbi:MAG: HAD-IC family P-type ATPase, partial [Actinomycetaceae bacterium]|nr:HAD-IC family P-type ATPase [Actinomycetaceae bacterium]